MEIGDLNCRVVIQQQVAGQDDLGQPNGAWTTLATVWANIKYLTGAETIRANAVAEVAKVSIVIRMRSDVTSAMQVVYKGVTYQILGVLPDLTTGEYMYLVCEVVS